MSGNRIKIDTVSGGVVQFGNSLKISPKHASKSTHGSGSSNQAVNIQNNNGINTTNTIDQDLIDQPIVKDK
ncbi:spore germination protein [Neobacillus sp.]|uniref:spore germination protein n=1 Tax=Neobacillus sp. TaxID=2675273 RepID=UPI0035B55A5C